MHASEGKKTHTISFLVANKPGVLGRVALGFARRGFNIDSLVVSPTEDGRYSRMSVTAQGDAGTLDQIIKQTGKLVDVLSVSDHTHEQVIEREIALLKVRTRRETQAELLQMISHFKGSTEDLTDGSLVIQLSGSTAKLDAFIQMVRPYGILEIVRSGKILMARGKETT